MRKRCFTAETMQLIGLRIDWLASLVLTTSLALFSAPRATLAQAPVPVGEATAQKLEQVELKDGLQDDKKEENKREEKNKKEKKKEEPKIKPLSLKEDPLHVGKRDINKGQINFYSLEREVALGRQMAAEIDRQSRLVTDPVVNEFINRVAQNIVLHSDAKVPFTVKVIDDDTVNAFALPGGFLYVYRGLLEAAENEAEIAGVMAHEIAHVTARHGVEQASKGELLNYASIPLIFMGGIGGYIIQQAAGIAIPLGFLKFSRGAEKEADRLGAQYMWAAGYDPNALITFFEKLQAKEKRKPGTLEKIFSSHPMTGDRITEVQKLIARFPEKNEYALSGSEFTQIRNRLIAQAASARSAAMDETGRPTLRRRPQTGDTRADDSVSSSGSDDRPVLRRSDSGSTGNAGTPTASDPADRSTGDDRPVLKRREAETDTTKPASDTTTPTSAPTDRPTLKRRPDVPAVQ